MARQHALLSASNAGRWLACPPSARLEELFDEPDAPSPYADEGTIAHELAEALLIKFLGGDADVEAVRAEKQYSQDMEDYVEVYVSYVKEAYAEALSRDEDARLLLEQRVDFSDYVPEGFGYADAIIIEQRRLEVIDLKYGAHIPVVAEKNPQLRLYALGMMEMADFLYDFEEVRTTIVQPRNTGISHEDSQAANVYDWAEEVVRPIAEKAFKGEGKRTPGPHCRFCLAAPRCRELRDKATVVKEFLDREPELLTDDELREVLNSDMLLSGYMNRVRQYVRDRLLQGKPLKGYKLVEGMSVRKYSDEEVVKKRLIENGYKPEEFTKLVGLTAMKKLLSAKKFNSLLGDLLVRPEGKPVLVPEDDARPEYDPSDGFTDLDAEKE